MTDALPWVDEGNRKRCTKHARVFGRTEICEDCAGEPRTSIAATKDPVAPPPKGCLSAVQLEAWFVALGRAAVASAGTVTKRKRLTFHDHSSIAKHRDNAIKAMRAALELAQRREDDAIVEAREAAMLGRDRGAGH